MSVNRKIIVGLFVVGGFFLFALGLFWIGDRRLLFSERLELETRFANLSGLKTGSKVMVSGMDAGEVLAIQVPAAPREKFRVRFRVLSQFQPILRADSVASVQVEGLVGSKVLQVESGSDAAAPIQPNSILPSREPVEISAIIQQSVDMINKVDSAVDEIEGRLIRTIDIVTDVGQQTQKLVNDVGSDVEDVFGTGKKIARDISSVTDGIRGGRGLVGRLLTDDSFAARVDNMTRHFEATTTRLSQTAENVQRITADVESRKLGETFHKTAANVERVTAQLKDVLAELRPPGTSDERGLLDDARASLENTREATSDLAENMEALKRNWFFRGYFNKRGFFDLDAVSLDDYRLGKVASDRDQQRSWLQADELFQHDPSGRETLSESGAKKLGAAMVPYLRFAPNTLLIVEGYAGHGAESEQFLHSRDRARIVRRYLVDRFGLKPNFVGAIPMGAVASSSPSGELWEGVSRNLLPGKEKEVMGTLKSMKRILFIAVFPWWAAAQDGFKPVIGGLPFDSGFALGVEYRKPALAGGPLDFRAKAIGSTKKYEFLEASLAAPGLARDLFAEVRARYRNYPEEDFWGLGPKSSRALRTTFRLEDIDYSATVGVRPKSWLSLGFRGGLLNVNAGPGKDADRPSIEQRFFADQVPALEFQPDYLHSGTFIEVDYRDEAIDPKRGGFYQFKWTAFHDRDFDRFHFQRYELDLRQFLPSVRDVDTIGLRALAIFSGKGADQQVPFFMQPTVGGGGDLRGYYQYRFRDENALVFSLEHRWRIREIMHVVGFADAGHVFRRPRDIGLSGLRGSLGIGGRLKLGDAFFLGADLAWSPDGPRLWFRGSHTF